MEAEDCVQAVAAEARGLGFRVDWLARATGEAVAAPPRCLSSTCRLSHPSWGDAVLLDFLPVCGRVVIVGALSRGGRRARTDVSFAEPRAALGRRLVTHVLRPLQSGEPSAATLAGLPAALSAHVLAFLTAAQCRRAAVTTRALRVEASRDALWSAFLRRDAADLDVDAPPGEGAIPGGPVLAIYKALALAAARARRRAALTRLAAEEESTIARRRDLLSRARVLGYEDDDDALRPRDPRFAPGGLLPPTFAPHGPTWAPAWAFGRGPAARSFPL